MKRIIAVILLPLLFLCLVGCEPKNVANIKGNDVYPFEKSLTVAFCYAEQAEPVFIRLPDGTSVLIDVGTRKETDKLISDYGISKIDYLIITDDNSNHYSALTYLLGKCRVERVLVPYFTDTDILSGFNVYKNLSDYGVPYSYTDISFCIDAEDYYLQCLSPSAYDSPTGEYFQTSLYGEVKNVAPVIYLSYAGRKILLSSDIDESTEDKIIKNCKVGLFPKVDISAVNLMRITACSKERAELFASTIPTDIAISHVSIENPSGNPYMSTLRNIKSVNKDAQIFRSPERGNIVYTVFSDGSVKLISDI